MNKMSLFTATTVEEVKRLIEFGHDVNLTKYYGKSVLYYFCEKGNLDIVKVLCEAGADVNEVNEIGFRNDSPVEIAVEAGYLDIVKYLIENYSVNLDDVLYIASATGFIDVLDYLLTLNLDLNRSRNNPLVWACYYGHIDAVDRLLSAGADINIIDDFGNTALILATSKCQLDIIKKLVMFGADYHRDGGESLVISCKYSYTKISKFLIDLGCNVNYCFYNMTPLMYACYDNNLKIIQLLLERGADPNFVNGDGKKAIDYCKSDDVRALFIKN